MLFALAVALPAAAENEAKFRARCFERSSNEQMIEGCRAVIVAGREPAEKLAQAYYTRASAYFMSGDNKRAIAAKALRPDVADLPAGWGVSAP